MVAGMDAVDWSYAQHELLEKQGVDLRKEMQARSGCPSVTNRIIMFASLIYLLYGWLSENFYVISNFSLTADCSENGHC